MKFGARALKIIIKINKNKSIFQINYYIRSLWFPIKRWERERERIWLTLYYSSQTNHWKKLIDWKKTVSQKNIKNEINYFLYDWYRGKRVWFFSNKL